MSGFDVDAAPVAFAYGIVECSTCNGWHPNLAEEGEVPRLGGFECHCGAMTGRMLRLGKRNTEAEARGALLAWMEENR